jgi:hypothetical protein
MYVKGDPRINRLGRPVGSVCKERKQLEEALAIAEKTHNKSFIQHFVDLAFTNHKVAVALAKKLLPDKIEGEGFAADIRQYIISRAIAAADPAVKQEAR